MTHEVLIEQINQIPRKQIPQDLRPAFLKMLRSRPDVLTKEDRTMKWKRGAIYFHAIQDLIYSTEQGVLREGIQESQACFAKDLDQFMEGLPLQEAKIHPLIQTIFDVGTSFVWEDDLPAVGRLHDLFQRADREIIRPWVNQGAA